MKDSNLRRYRKDRIELTPRSGLEQTIKELHDNYRFKRITEKLTVDDGLNAYLNARNCRHDLWVELLNEMVTSITYKIGDVNFREFALQIKIDYNFQDYVNQNLTPDILIYIRDYNYIILGDVTVTRAVDMANRRKYFKYFNLEKSLKENGFKVRHMNLVIDEALTNYNQELKKFQDLNVININNISVKRTIEYQRTCQILMDSIGGKCEDPKEFKRMLDLIDRVDHEDSSIKIDQSILDNNDLLDCTPIESEETIINWIKDEVDGTGVFFDDDIQQTKDAFDKLLIKDKNKIYTSPKSTLKVVSNQMSMEMCSNYDLLLDYIRDIHFSDDSEVSKYLLDLLPNKVQIELMSKIYNDKESKRKATSNDKMHRVYGPYQYDRTIGSNNLLTMNLNDALTKGKKNPNVKSQPKTINPDMFQDSINQVDTAIIYYGSMSNKETFLNNDWDGKSNFEMENSKEERKLYNLVRSTNGAQVCQSMSNLYHRIMHLKTSLSLKDNIYIPPNGSFIAIIPRNHAPITSKNCDLPIIFVSRINKKEHPIDIKMMMNGNEIEHKLETDNYIYIISKLSRFSLDKIQHWDQLGYKLVSTCTYLLSTCDTLRPVITKVVGLITLLMLDGHQKTSEFLDLLKYVAFMPFSDISRLSKLIEDKFSLLIKTNLDVWLITRMRDFIIQISNTEEMKAVKPKLQLFNSTVTRDSLGLTMNIPSFIDPSIRHATIANFIEEIAMVYIIRPKHLYGSQFMDKSISLTAEWNNEYQEEIDNYGTWATEGHGNGRFPFGSKFCFSRDAIYYAQKNLEKNIAPSVHKIEKKLSTTTFNSYMHYNCSLRGCVKDYNDRKNLQDLHTTSMDACLKYYMKEKYVDEKCTALSVATDFIKSGIPMEFSMSEKDQRGGGRPIATPTLGTKAALMMIEKPEQAIGTYVGNNIIVEGKHKLKAQSDAYKKLLSNGAVSNFKQVYQLTEDQSKFSENDNTRKYYYYVSCNNLLPANVRRLQLCSLKKLIGREHLVRRIPRRVNENPDLSKHRNPQNNGIITDIGWPQGMLNFISTSVHSIADYWITRAFNIAYPETPVMTEGLVHSDDSWVSVACDDLETFKKFVLFRTIAKKLFCLKLNDKKVWGSKYLGELVSNYNINGNVHLSVAKTLANSFGNLIYQNWTIDVHTQISSIQQAYRNGANIPILIMLSTILRQQMIDCYQVSGYQKSHISLLPIELGGYPNSSAFELGVTGVTSHYKNILEYVKTNPTSNISEIILKALRLSIMHNIDNEKMTNHVEHAYSKTGILSNFINPDPNEEINDVDYESVTVPSRGEVFSCVKHIIPKSKKIAETIKMVKSLPYASDDLEMIITKPKELSVALGHLKSQTSTMLYQLAAERYTQSARRLAISQAIQSSGKVVRICKFNPMTINEMLYFLYNSNIEPMDVEKLEVALNDETDLSLLCESAVYRSELQVSGSDKRRIINKMPNIDDKFKTVCKLSNVLLALIDRRTGSEYYKNYTNMSDPIEILKTDGDLIEARFYVYFKYYNIKYACNLIMQQYLSKVKAKLWMQPFIKNDSLDSFVSDLYGKTINKNINYIVNMSIYGLVTNQVDHDTITSLYTVSVLNDMYGKFDISILNGETVEDVLNQIDYAKLNNDDYLRYAVLRKYHLNDESHIREYDTRKMYDQHYTKPQQFVNNKWVGEFECYTRYGNTTVIISGEPEDINIVVNRINLSDILMAMHIFVKNNFKHYSYPHPNNWSQSKFWESKIKISHLFMTAYNSIVTMITQRASIYSFNFSVNNNIKMPMTYNNLNADYYITEECLRVVYKVIDEAKVKVASIQQSMSCPKAEEIHLKPDIIDGFDNNELLHSRVMLDITLKRHFNCSRSDLLKLVQNKLPSPSGGYLINLYINILNKFSDLNIYIDTETIDVVQEMTTYEIEGMGAINYIEKNMETSPEDLTFLEADYVYDEDARIGNIYKHDNLNRLITSLLCTNYNIGDIIDIFKILFNDKSFIDNLQNDLDLSAGDLQEKIELLREVEQQFEFDIETYCFVIGTMLDHPDTLGNINFNEIISDDFNIYNTKNYRIGKMLISEINYNIHEVEDEIKDSKLSLLSKLKGG
nr:MAG: RNA-dependent RNA polymerase [Tibet bird virus 1]